MDNIKKAKLVVKELIKLYGATPPTYHKNKPYEFLFAVMMSSQCTDKRVNDVTNVLYKKYTTLTSFAKLKNEDLEKIIRPVGFYHNKANNIIKTAKKLIVDFDSTVPNNIDDLLKLPGVGRKTANVVLGQLYNIPSMAVDTHVKRVSNILFHLNEEDTYVIEERLKNIVDKKYWNIWNTHIIALGREFCIANRPKCDICPIRKICKDAID